MCVRQAGSVGAGAATHAAGAWRKNRVRLLKLRVTPSDRRPRPYASSSSDGSHERADRRRTNAKPPPALTLPPASPDAVESPSSV